MVEITDRFGLLADREAQVSVLHAGWRFYERMAAGPEAGRALSEWADAFGAVLALGEASASDLRVFQAALAAAVDASTTEELRATFRGFLHQLQEAGDAV